MNKSLFLFFVLIFSITAITQSKQVPSDHVLNDSELMELLDINYSPELIIIQAGYTKGNKEEALEHLANYFKEKFAVRFF
ncbi:MAG: hypothetical protein MUC93_13660 [Bacteroidales bacterium]|jgi:hypothetical protein|nr:hypothetical protein [Bacteroidales bacterium]